MADIKFFDDCFAYDGKKRASSKCTILTYPYCAEEGHCSFYKTKSQHEMERYRNKEIMMNKMRGNRDEW